MLWIGLPKPKILIVSAKFLVIQINMKQLAHFQSRGDLVNEVKAGHMFVGHFGIDAAHLGMIQRGDQREINCP